MRFSLFSFIALFIGCFSLLPHTEAQLPNGSFAPNFTGTDIDGNSYELYDLLDQGKVVIIDFFATWCGPCWYYHQSNDLEKIWQQYGPSGTDELFVFYVEGDPFTNIDALHGIGSNTYGNYTAGVSFPIINNNVLANLYHVSYWPTVYLICPDKRTTEIGHISPAKIENLLEEKCSGPTGINNAEIMGFESNLDPFCQFEQYLPRIRFQNLGSNPILEASFDLLANGEIIHANCQWQGYLLPFASTSLDFAVIDLDKSSEIAVRINSINGEIDNTPPNNEVKGVKSTPMAFSKNMTVEVKTDNFGYEIYWELRDANGQVFASGGNDYVVPGGPQLPSYLITNPNGYYQSDTTYVHQVSVPSYGCYEFYIIDDYGDGMCCTYGNGYFKLTDDWGRIVLSGGKNFSTFSNMFEVTYGSTTAVENAVSTPTPLNIFPNPTDGEITLAMDVSNPRQTQLSIYSATGQRVVHPKILLPQEEQTIDLSLLFPGLYFLHFQIGDERLIRKIVVE